MFQVSQVFYEAYTRDATQEQIQQALRKFKSASTGGSQKLLFERKEGQPPVLQYISEDGLEWSEADTVFFAEELNARYLEEYRLAVQRELEALGAKERPIDLLILVPRAECREHEIAREALRGLGVRFIDYCREDNRRNVAQSTMVRLCTYHSARGLEGMRVLVFGIDGIDNLANAIKVTANNLGYIVLSRSLFECSVLGPPPREKGPVRFLERVLELIQPG